MAMHKLLSSCALGVFFVSAPVMAQEGDAAPQDDSSQPVYDGSILREIVVSGARLRGQVDAAQAPVIELNEADIAAYGENSIADLVSALAPETGSSRGRGGGQPVFLVNGIRVGSFREFRSYPTEAIRKVEVLPEEVAQKFGYPPDRRVINFILKDKYSSLTLEVDRKQPAKGGFSRIDNEATLLKIVNGGRINAHVETTNRSMLTEAERDVVQTQSAFGTVSTDPSQAAYRSLIKSEFSAEATVNYAKAYTGSGASLSINGTYQHDRTLGLSGLNTVLLTDPAMNRVLRTFGANNPLTTSATTDTFSTAASYGRPIGAFQMTATADASLANATTEIDRRADTSALVQAAAAGTFTINGPLPPVANAGYDIAKSRTGSVSSKLTLVGTPVMLPAGELGTTFFLGYDWDQINSQDTRTTTVTQLTRGDLSGGINMAVPLTSSREGFLGVIGDLTLNLAGGFERYSDFGTLYNWSGGATWSPWPKLDLSATYTNRQAPPSLAQLGNPQIVTYNVPTYDFQTGTTQLVTITSGGNPFLIAETQNDWTFSANWELPFIEGARAQASYTRNSSRNVSSAFPLLTSPIEAAFPGRVTRDASGRLIAIDSRPVTFDSTKGDRLAFGLSLRGSFGKAKEVPTPGGRGKDGRGQRAGGLPGFGGGDGRGRFFINLNHTVELHSTVLVAPGGPSLDLLNGDSLSSGGTSRNSTQLEGGMFRNGWGLRVSGRYTGPSRVDGSGLPGSSDLHFGALATVNLRLFTDLGEIFRKKQGLLKGMRASLRADNVFDGIQHVTDQNGIVPLSYQPGLVDPVGRYLGLEVRKQF